MLTPKTPVHPPDDQLFEDHYSLDCHRIEDEVHQAQSEEGLVFYLYEHQYKAMVDEDKMRREEELSLSSPPKVMKYPSKRVAEIPWSEIAA